MSKIDVMWVGLSAKNDKVGNKLSPLDSSSNSGKVVDMIEAQHENLSFYRTNLVKYAPLDERGKLRYPNSSEMATAMPELMREFEECQPKIVFLLGGRVGDFVQDYLKQNHKIIQTVVCKIYHPSYIYIYKRKQLDKYVREVSKKIEKIA